MTNRSPESRLARWLEQEAPAAVPPELRAALDRELEGTSPMPRLVALLTMTPLRRDGSTVVGAPALRVVAALAALALVLVAMAASLMAGSRLFAERVPSPFGPAENGILAFDSGGTILVLDEPNGPVRPLLVDLPGASSPTFSPNGRWMAFFADGTAGSSSVWVVRPDGTERRELADGLWIATDKAPAWSPDERYLVVSSETGANRGDEQLLRIPIDAAAPRTVLGAIPGLRRLLPAWSPDGDWIAFQGIAGPDDGSAGLYVIRGDGSDEHRLHTTGKYGFLPPGARWDPARGSNRLVYEAGASTAKADIYLYDVDTSRETLVSGSPDIELAPAWSPDGAQIAWLDLTRNVVRVARVDGSDLRELHLSDTDVDGCSWSPDGTWIVASRSSGGIELLDPRDVGNPIVVTAAPAQGHPSWQRTAP